MSVRRVVTGVVVTVLAATVVEVAAGKSLHRLSLGLDEFTIAPGTTTAAPGNVTLRVVNRGAQTHELLVIRGAARLPIRNGRVDEAALERAGRLLGEIADVKRGATASKAFRLTRGSYILLCNLPGHYKSGMHATLAVG